MTSKPALRRAGSSSQTPSPFASVFSASTSSISASHILLPSSFDIHFAIFSSGNSSHGHQDIEAARQTIVSRNAGASSPDTLYSYSQLSRTSIGLWAFLIKKESLIDDDFVYLSHVGQLHFPGLTREYARP